MALRNTLLYRKYLCGENTCRVNTSVEKTPVLRNIFAEKIPRENFLARKTRVQRKTNAVLALS